MTLIEEPLVLADTTGLSHEEWLAVRRSMVGLGGSDAATAIGVSPYSAPVMLWAEKTGRVPPSDEDNESMFWGRTLEDVVAGVFARRHPELRVWPDKKIYGHPHPELSFMFANVDRRVNDDGLLEVKTADKDMAPHWDGGPPIYYQVQANHYLAVLGLAYCWVIVLLGGNRYREYLIERDDEMIDTIVRLESRFWYENVLADVPPHAIGIENETDWLSEQYPTGWRPAGADVLLTPELIDVVEDLRAVKESLKMLKDDEERLKNELKIYMGNATEGLDPATGRPLVTWRAHDQDVFDKETFAVEQPDLAAKYRKKIPVRTMLLPKPRKGKK